MPHTATSPKAKITLLGGAFAGLFAGIIVVFLQQTLSNRYQSEEQIRRMIKLPVYGTIPAQKLVGSEGNFFGPSTPNSFKESFRLLKRNLSPYTKLEKIGSERKSTVILVISANERDGKTTVAANLAKTFADDGKRVVMLDCDFYLSRLRKMKDFNGAAGLTDWLATGERPCLQLWPGEAFSIITAGTVPAENVRLDESPFSEIIATLRSEYDCIVLDSPPLPTVSDGLVLADFADVILSVVSVKNTARRDFGYHNELIAGIDRPHGLIINGTDGVSYTDTEAYFTGRLKKWRTFTGRLDMRGIVRQLLAADE